MYIGIDVGGMSIKAGIVTKDGNIIARHAVPTPLDNNEGFCSALLEATLGVLQDANLKKEDVEAIGIGVPGAVNRDKGVLLYANNIPYDNVPAREYLQKNIADVPVMVENDANCAALGEFYQAEGASDFVFVTLGTGVGGGIVIDGKLYTGSNGVGGEIGHIVTHSGGRACTCGRLGCWEAYASVTGLIKLTEENRDKIKSVSPDEKISGRTVFEYAKNGDDEAKRVRDEWIQEVAIGITDIVNIFQPDEIVIGGAISKEGDVLLEPVRQYVKENGYIIDGLTATRIVASRIGGDAGIIGAALLWKNLNKG